MARRKKNRLDPLSEGSLKQIYDWFFAPLIYFKPAQVELKDWAEQLFDFSNRDIVRYRARANFTIPGLFYEAANVKVQGLGYRQVRAGDDVFVRTDARNPQYVDVEVIGEKDQVFNLTQSEFNSIGVFLVEQERDKQYAQN